MKDITRLSSVLDGTGSRRYRAPAQAFHWITAALIFAVVPLGWIFGEFKTGPASPDRFEGLLPGTPALFGSMHKTIGLTILAVVVVRLLYRAANPPPALPGRMAEWERRAARMAHGLLYAVLILMPVSGYVMSSASVHPISILGLFDFPKLPVDKAMGNVAHAVHIYTQWGVYALVGLHIAATAWHLVIRRDAILDRMLPRQIHAE